MPTDELSGTFPGLEIREKIGGGGMGAVFKAYQAALDRLVALKTVRPEFLTPEGLQLFQREARLLAKCNHPNIVRILEFHPEHPAPHFLMEYVDGIPLDQALKGRTWAEKARLFQDVVATVASAHDHGVVHGDLKPSNILVDHRFQPHILDFGLARLARGEAAEAGEVGGTFSYLAPEVFEGSPTSFLSDIYALGITIYRLLTGLLPYPTLDEILAGRARLPAEVDLDVPEPLQRICLKAMERRPENRYQTADQMQRDLERFWAGKPIFVRPTRYQEELQGRVGNHLTEVQLWQQEGFISQRERDGLVGSYQGILAGDSPWLSETRTMLTGPLLIRVGSWCLFLSSLLWPVFYWDRLSRPARVASTGLPVGLMAVLGIFFLVRRHRRYALACLGSFVLLLLVFQITLLDEFHWLEYPQGPEWELWRGGGERTPGNDLSLPFVPEGGMGVDQAIGKPGKPEEHSKHLDEAQRENPREKRGKLRPPGRQAPRPVPPGPDSPAGEPLRHIRENQSELSLSNSQLFFIALTTTLCITLLLYALRAAFFAPWLATACLVLFTTGLLLVGDKERLLHQRGAWVALHYLGFVPVLYLLGYVLERRTAPRLAKPFYVVATGTGLLAGAALAAFAAEEWFQTAWGIDNEIWNFWLMAYSVPTFCWAWQTERFGTEGQRILTWWLYLFVPILILFPLQVLFSKGLVLFTVGPQPLHLYAALYLPACVALLVLGRALHLELFLMAALCGLAVWVFRMTFRHFWEEESWPILIGLTGALLVGLGVWRSRWRDLLPEEFRRQSRLRGDSRSDQPSGVQGETVVLPR